MFVSQAPEEPRSAGSLPGPRGDEGVLHVCQERVGELELWLQKAQRSLVSTGASAMQDSVEQQLLTCQVSSAHEGTPQDLQLRRSAAQNESNEAESENSMATLASVLTPFSLFSQVFLDYFNCVI